MECGGCNKINNEDRLFFSEAMDKILNERSEKADLGVDRFDLEQAIMHQLDITDDLELLCSHILDNGIDVDKITNILNGLIEIHKMKNEHLFDVFCQVFDLDG